MTSNQRKINRIVIYSVAAAVTAFLIVFLLWSLRPMILPFILGAFIAYLFKPLMNNFKGSTVTKYSKIVVFFAFLGTLFYWGGRLIKESMPSEKEKLELQVRLKYRLNERYVSWMNINAETNKGNYIYNNFGEELNPLIKKMNDFLKLTPEQIRLFFLYRKGYNGQTPIADKYYEYFLQNSKLSEESQAAFLNQENQVVENTPEKKEGEGLFSLIHNLSIWLIFPLTFLFLLFDKGEILRFSVRQIPNRYFELILTVVDRVDEALGKYIRGTVLECTLVGVTLHLGFWICGIPFKAAFLIGAIGGFTNAIPFFGTVMACVVGCAYALIAEDVHSFIPLINANNLMIAVIAVVMIAHFLDNAIYQPLVLGGAVNLHPLIVILGVFGGSMLFGFAGMLLAIPTIVVIKVVVETFFHGLKAYRII